MHHKYGFKANFSTEGARLQIGIQKFRPILSYGCEEWSIRAQVASRLTGAELVFMRRTTGYTK